MFQTKLRTLALTATLLTAPAWADEGFANRDFKGDYAFHLDGVLTSAPGSAVVTAYDAAIGQFTADGAGNITQGTRSVSANSTNVEETLLVPTMSIPMAGGRQLVTLVSSVSRLWTSSWGMTATNSIST